MIGIIGRGVERHEKLSFQFKVQLNVYVSLVMISAIKRNQWVKFPMIMEKGMTIINDIGTLLFRAARSANVVVCGPFPLLASIC